MTEKPKYPPCPHCKDNLGYQWQMIDGRVTVRPCEHCKGTGLIMPTFRDRQFAEMQKGQNTDEP